MRIEKSVHRTLFTLSFLGLLSGQISSVAAVELQEIRNGAPGQPVVPVEPQVAPQNVLPQPLTPIQAPPTGAPDEKSGTVKPLPPVKRPPPAAKPPTPPQPPAPPPAAPPSSASPADDAASLRPGEMLFNFQEADIQAVVKTVSQITGRNFLMDPRVKGKITIISTRPVSKNAVYQIFLAALKAQGFTAVTGPADILKIVPVNEAKQDAEVSSGPSLSGGEQTVTHVVTVQHGSATQMVALLRPLMAPTSQLSVYAPANTLIITDYASNIQSLLRIVGILDREGAAAITIVALKHASATDIADVITRLYPNVMQAMPGVPQMPQVGESERVLIFPDPRTNSMLIRTDNQSNLKQVRDLIDRLDVPAKVGGNTRVVYLRNADAVKMAEILRGLMSGERSAQAAAPAVPGRPAGAKGAEASLIQADEATNSLIISASDAVFNNLRAVIEKLDVRRAQVYIEALIAEVSTEKASEFGFQWAAGTNVRGGTAGAVANFPASGVPIVGAAAADSAALAGSLSKAAGLSLAYVGKDITLSNGTTVRGLGALARALEEQSIANILSTPNLLTLDNAEAKIIVGKNVPFLTGSFSQAGGTATGAVNPFQTIDRQDVGLTLKIKPQISEGGSIKLKILQEVSSLAGAVGVGASDLITNKRSIDTTVIVDDGHTVVLGGLVEDNVSETTQAVPFLGRIPLLGWLFKYRTQKKTKTNLMVFLRPVIVRSPQDSYNFTTSRYEYIRALERLTGKENAPLLENFKPVKPPEKDESAPNNAYSVGPEMPFGPPNIPNDADKKPDQPLP